MSDKKLLKSFNDYSRPSVYCNISNKDSMNIPTTIQLDELSNSDIFLSEKNIHYMTYFIISMNKKNMTKTNPQSIKIMVPKMMHDWSINENLNDYEYIYDNILLRVAFINKRFIKEFEWIYDGSNKLSMNVFRVSNTVTVDDKGNEETKKYSEMTAQDYANMDVWKSNQEYTHDKRSRYNNEIPIWQKSMNVRKYETESEGLHTLDPDRASLNTQVRGYNMNNYIKGSEYLNNKF